MVGHAEVLGPVLGRNRHRQSAAQRGIDHALVHALGVHVDFHLAAACRNALEDSLPELVTSLRDAALSVYAKGDAADLRNRLEQSADRVTAIRAVGFGSEAFDGVVGVGARDPAVAVHPDAQLELHAARHGLLADEAQHLQVAIALGVRQLRHAHVIPGHGKQEWIGKQKVRIGDGGQEVVADAQREIEPVEALRRQHGQVRRPHLAVVVPGLVFDFAGEEARDAADGIGRALGHRLTGQRGPRAGHRSSARGQPVPGARRSGPARRVRRPICRLFPGTTRALPARLPRALPRSSVPPRHRAKSFLPPKFADAMREPARHFRRCGQGRRVLLARAPTLLRPIARRPRTPPHPPDRPRWPRRLSCPLHWLLPAAATAAAPAAVRRNWRRLRFLFKVFLRLEPDSTYFRSACELERRKSLRYSDFLGCNMNSALLKNDG